VHLVDQLDRGLDAVLQAFVLRASYVDLGIAPTELEPSATTPAHHGTHIAPSVASAIHTPIILPVLQSFVIVSPVMRAIAISGTQVRSSQFGSFENDSQRTRTVSNCLLRSRHHLASFKAGLLEEPDRTSTSAPFQGDKGNGLGAVAKVDVQSP
jgi:hypothetical protein